MTYVAKPGKKSAVVVEVHPSKGAIIRWDLSEADALEVVEDLHRLARAARNVVGGSLVLVRLPVGPRGWFTDEIAPEEAVALADSIADVLEGDDAVS